MNQNMVPKGKHLDTSVNCSNNGDEGVVLFYNKFHKTEIKYISTENDNTLNN